METRNSTTEEKKNFLLVEFINISRIFFDSLDGLLSQLVQLTAPLHRIPANLFKKQEPEVFYKKMLFLKVSQNSGGYCKIFKNTYF